MVRKFLTIVRTGVRNVHGCPLNFLATDKAGRRVELSPFEDSEESRIVILPAQLPAELAALINHPQMMVARVPGCDRFTYRLVGRRNLEPVCRVRVERQTQDVQFSDGTWWAKDEEVVSATQFLCAGRQRLTLNGVEIEG